MLLVIGVSLYAVPASGNPNAIQKTFENHTDTLVENKIAFILDSPLYYYCYGKLIYTANLDTLVYEISNAHRTEVPKMEFGIQGFHYYWESIQEPYWYYGGHCLLMNVKKINESKYALEFRINYSGYNPLLHPLQLSFRERESFYQQLVDQAVMKSADQE